MKVKEEVKEQIQVNKDILKQNKKIEELANDLVEKLSEFKDSLYEKTDEEKRHA